MEWALLLLTILPIILIQATGVAALTSNSDIIGIAVAGCASFALLTLVIGMLIASCNWKSWFRNWMRQQGKIRMPEDYFKKKKGETKQRLISGSQRVHIPQMNGHRPRPHVDIPQMNGHLPRPHVDTEKLVQGWRHGNPGVSHRSYEEKDAMVELGDEVDDEYKIETEVVDNEILDVGPFKQDHSKEIPIRGDVYLEPYIYSTVDNTKMSGRSVGNSVKPPNDFRTSAVVGDKSDRSVGNSVKPPNDFRISAVVGDKSDRSVGNSVKPASDSRTSAVVGDKSDRSVGNSVKPSNESTTPGVVTKSNGAEYYMAGTNKDKKFDEGLLYM